MKNFVELSAAKKVERWENVLRVLKNLSPHQRRKHFDMNNFLEETACGTVGCAAGHCAMDPWFRRRGLKAELESDGYWYLPDGVDLHDYFGEGSRTIFHNYEPRPVGVVMKEVRAHLKDLRALS